MRRKRQETMDSNNNTHGNRRERTTGGTNHKGKTREPAVGGKKRQLNHKGKQGKQEDNSREKKESHTKSRR